MSPRFNRRAFIATVYSRCTVLGWKKNANLKQLINYLRSELAVWDTYTPQILIEKQTKRGIEWALADRIFAAIIGKKIFLRLPEPISDAVQEWPVATRVSTAEHPFKGWISISLGEDPRRYLRGLLRTAFEYTLTEVHAAQ